MSNAADEDETLEAIQLRITKTELAIKEAELRQKVWDFEHPHGSFGSTLRNPIFVGAVITALVTSGATLVSFVNSRLQLSVEREKAQLSLNIASSQESRASIFQEAQYESALVMKAMELGGGDTEKTVGNIEFLLQSGLLYTVQRRQGLTCYVAKKRGQQPPGCSE